MRTIAVLNHKGGVAKTTTVQNMSAGIALSGIKVLMIDLDPQANLTKGFGLFNIRSQNSIYPAFLGKSDLQFLEVRENLFLAPSHLDFAACESELASNDFRAHILTNLIEKIKDKFDYCFIDCPPSFGVMITNALVAADYVLIPIEAEFYSWTGLDSIFTAAKMVSKNLKNDKFFAKDKFVNIGAFITKVKNQRSITSHIREKAQESLGSLLYNSEIRENVAIVESQARGKDIFEHDSESNGAKDYRKLIAEFLKH